MFYIVNFDGLEVYVLGTSPTSNDTDHCENNGTELYNSIEELEFILSIAPF